MKYYSSWLWLVVALLCMSAHGQNMNIRSYKVEDGLPQTQVLSLHRDPTGYLWVGTYSGAARYNGREWVIHDQKRGMPDNHVTSFLSDHEGKLWMGTFGNGLAQLDGKRITRFPAETVQGSCHVVQMISDRKNRVWIATDQGLLIYDAGVFKRITMEDGLPDLFCNYLFEDPSGLIYVATRAGLVAILDDHVQLLNFSDAFSDRRVTVVTEDSDRRLWVGTERGLFHVKGAEVIRASDPLLSEAHITATALEEESGIWFGTQRQGAFKLVGEQVARTLSTTNGLSAATIKALLFDQEHTLWLGTDSGLDKYRPGQFVALTREHGLLNTFARALYLDPQQLLWVGTRDGVYTVTPDFTVTRQDTSAFRNQRIFAIDRLPGDTMMFVTEQNLVLSKAGKVTNYGEESGLSINNLRCGMMDSNGMIWVGGNGLTRFDGTHFYGFPIDHPLHSLRILNMKEDLEGRILLGSWIGLGWLDPHTGKTVFLPEAKTSIWDIDTDGQGNVWIGTNGEGLWRYDGKSVTKFTTENSDLTNGYVWQVFCADNGDIWAGHNLGIDRIRDDKFVHYSISDGLAGNEGCAAAVLSDQAGRIWFGTGEGISIYQSNETDSIPVVPKVVMEQVSAKDLNGKAQVVLEDERLARNHNSLSFRYAAMSFAKEEDIEYSHQLEGLERQWSPSEQRGEGYFVNLSPKTYHFRVKARNSGGEWSGETRFHFSVAPAFYETALFRLAVFIAFIGITLYYVHKRLTRVERRNRELEILVHQRTEELVQKGLEFREMSLSDPLTQMRNRRFVAETMREEMSRLRRRYFRYQQGDSFTCLGLVVLDLDYFKSVNDRYGHDAGDTVLIETANRLKFAVRDSDVVARWGGEEFLILFKDIHPDELAFMAHKLLEVLRSQPFEIGSESLKRTASAGFAYMHPGLVKRDVPWEWTFKVADLALFRAKDSGRDRACGIEFNSKVSPDDWYEAVQEEPELGLAGDVLTLIESS